jgi:hypothetical protein
MFDNNSEELIHWFEKLETKCQQLIYEKSESWFQTKLELMDIESAFSSIIRIYKSGKFYLVRTNIKNNSLNNMPIIKIYDQNENILSIEDVTPDSNVISILEIQGIKFTNRSFQIEIELKQVMVLSDEPIFENCVIKTEHFRKNPISKEPTPINMRDLEKEIIDEMNEVKSNVTFQKPDFFSNNEKENSLDNSLKDNLRLDNSLSLENNVDNNFDDTLNSNDHDDIVIHTENTEDSENVPLEIEELSEFDLDNSKDLKEVDFHLSLENYLEKIEETT